MNVERGRRGRIMSGVLYWTYKKKLVDIYNSAGVEKIYNIFSSLALYHPPALL